MAVASSIDLALATAATFEPYVGAAFEVEADGSQLTLISAAKTRFASPDQNRPFALVFEGASVTPLRLRIHSLRTADGSTLELFLVPIASTGSAYQYEALFN